MCGVALLCASVSLRRAVCLLYVLCLVVAIARLLHGITAPGSVIDTRLAHIVRDAAVDLSPAELGVVVELSIEGSDAFDQCDAHGGIVFEFETNIGVLSTLFGQNICHHVRIGAQHVHEGIAKVDEFLGSFHVRSARDALLLLVVESENVGGFWMN